MTRIQKNVPAEFDRTPYIFERTRVDDRGDETTEIFYSVSGRKQEFLFLYPEGRFITSLVDVRPNFVIAKCEIYLCADDEKPFRVAFATRELDTSTDIGRRFIECAETAAIGRALANAGIGADALLDDLDKQEQEETTGTPIGKKPAAGSEPEKEKPKATRGPKPKSRGQKAKSSDTDESKEETPSAADKKEEASPETDVDALQTLITTTESKTLKGKTFAEALTMVTDMRRFRTFLTELAENGTEAEKKAVNILMVKFSKPQEEVA